MALDKLVDSAQLDSDLTSVANAIRTKGGTSASLAFPSGFVSAVEAIESGGGCSMDDIVDGSFPSGRVLSAALSMPDWAINLRNVAQAWSLFSRATQVGNSAVRRNKNLTSIVFPNLITAGTVGGYTFAENETTFRAADLGPVATINPNAFFNCNVLDTIILRGSTLTALANVNGIANGTPFKSGGAGGTVYIPKALYDELGTGSANDYKAATNWSTVDGYGTITWAAIEGSIYETQYADGTPIK